MRNVLNIRPQKIDSDLIFSDNYCDFLIYLKTRDRSGLF